MYQILKLVFLWTKVLVEEETLCFPRSAEFLEVLPRDEPENFLIPHLFLVFHPLKSGLLSLCKMGGLTMLIHSLLSAPSLWNSVWWGQINQVIANSDSLLSPLLGFLVTQQEIGLF